MINCHEDLIETDVEELEQPCLAAAHHRQALALENLHCVCGLELRPHGLVGVAEVGPLAVVLPLLLRAEGAPPVVRDVRRHL